MSHNEKKEKAPPGFDRTLRTMEHHGHYHRKFLRGKYRRRQLDDKDTSPTHSNQSDASVKTEENNDIESEAFSKPSNSNMSRLDRGNNAFTSHKVFIELEELNEDCTQDMEWKETARWIKFEEDVNKVKGGFDRPHVSTLSFHSLSDVRKGIQTGCVLLDLEATSLTHVSFQVVNSLIALQKLDKNHRDDVLKALLLRHHHEHHHSFWEDLKNTLHLHHHHHHGRPHLQSQSSTESPIDQKHHGFRLRSRTMSITLDEIQEMDLSRYTPELDRALSTNEDAESHHSLVLDDNTEATAVLVGPLQSLDEPLLAFVRLKEARKLGNLLEVNLPVRFLFLLLGPLNCSLNYHEIGRSIATLMSNQDFHDALYAMKTEDELLKAIDSFLDESIVVPPGDWNFTEAEKKDTDNTAGVPDTIIFAETYLKKPSLIPFSGLFRDFKNVFNPFRYWSDYWDGFNNAQCILVVCFVFFACLGPTLVFGGLYDEKTNHQIGEIESLLASLVFGVIFSIFAGQPLMILGVSGPLLIFDEIIFEFSHLIGIDFLTFRVWIGLWLASFLLIVVALQGSFLVRYFTRFSEEIIASLTVFIFLIEAIYYIIHLVNCYPIEGYCPSDSMHLNSSNISINSHGHSMQSNLSHSNTSAHHDTECQFVDVDPCHSKILVSNTALFSILLIFGTFWLLLTLRRFRHSKFLRKFIRHIFSDFGILISLAIFTILSFLIRGKIYIETVGFPENFEPTTKRSWFISPFGEHLDFKPWAGFLACIPAAILCILIVMETQLTSLLIAKKHHRLKKPVGFHLDLLLVAFFSAVSGFFGFPWFCGVAVRSLQHVQALAIYSHESPGVVPHIVGIREQRMTNLFIHLLIGVCIPILWAAKRHLGFSLPLPVLFGGLIYLGFISWKSLQFAVRLRLMFMPSKHHPNTSYVKNVSPSRMHTFTIIQLICFGIILAVKLVTWTALLFPILCLLLVPFRKFFHFHFTPTELEALDHEDDCPKDLGENDGSLSEFETTHIPI